jgi:hypothetical protein
VTPKSSGDESSNRGSNFEKNKRPASSKRVTYALGAEAQEQGDRIARILSVYQSRGVSQSAVVRGLLQFAESIALQSGDPVVKPVFKNSEISASAKTRKIVTNKKEAAMIWDHIRSVILDS